MPSRSHSPEEIETLYASGPVAMVHMLAPSGRPTFDVGVMTRGISLVLASVIVLALLLGGVASALPHYASRARLIVWIALLATLVIDVGDAVWWTIPGGWVLAQGLYDFTAILIPGLILARFVR